jgi:hypothetical protein
MSQNNRNNNIILYIKLGHRKLQTKVIRINVSFLDPLEA